MILKTALVIMAAGIGSRFGGGIKQLEPVGPDGEIIMDYSIHDALEAGFEKIVFIIRRDIEEDFRSIIGERIEKICRQRGVEVCYAFQSLEDVPAGAQVPEGRTKPWGTGQAVLAAKPFLDCPFAVINADDYYGRESYVLMHEFLCRDDEDDTFGMMGFVLKNTLSEHGGVTRGVCKVDAQGYLTEVIETQDIVKTANGAAVNGVEVDANASVSMNMWGLRPAFVPVLEQGFRDFFDTAVREAPLKAEYLLPIFIGGLLCEGAVRVRVLRTEEKWFGVTYREDKPAVQESFRRLIEAGVYQVPLFGNEK